MLTFVTVYTGSLKGGLLTSDFPDFSYLNENGKRVCGSAALLHHIYTECGGVQKYNDKVASNYLATIIRNITKEANMSIAKAAKKTRLKKVG